MTCFLSGIDTGTFGVAIRLDLLGETVPGNPRATLTAAMRQVLSFPNTRKYKVWTLWPYCIHSTSHDFNHPSVTKISIVVANFIVENSRHDKTKYMARTASSHQGQQQHVASERASGKYVRQWSDRNSTRVYKVKVKVKKQSLYRLRQALRGTRSLRLPDF